MKEYVLITGCTSGIGRSLAFEFAKHGHNLFLVSRSIDKLKEVKNEINIDYKVDIHVLAIDLTYENAHKIIYDEMIKEKMNVNCLCNNAGMGVYGEFVDGDLVKINQLLQLNITFITNLTYLYAKLFKAKKEGNILNIASTGGFVPGPYMSCYYASKAYVLSFTEAIAMELKKSNVNVCCICPGPTKTDFFEKACDYKYNLLKNINAMNSDDVAKVAYKSLYKKKIVAIPGLKNKLGIWGVKLMPRKMTRKILYNIQKNRHK